ncbi:TPA: type IV secretory system conjugative DNA transfer family protein, partial [Streptococcus suis]
MSWIFIPSFDDLLLGIGLSISVWGVMYSKKHHAKKFRHGVEYGSARWGDGKDIQPYEDPIFENNILLTNSEKLTMNSRPSNPKFARNKNILVVGGSGS